MACLDIELCEKIDTLNLNVENTNLLLATTNEQTLQISQDLISLNDYVQQTNGYIYFAIVAFIVYRIVSWIFSVFRSIALG